MENNRSFTSAWFLNVHAFLSEWVLWNIEAEKVKRIINIQGICLGPGCIQSKHNLGQFQKMVILYSLFSLNMEVYPLPAAYLIKYGVNIFLIPAIPWVRWYDNMMNTEAQRKNLILMKKACNTNEFKPRLTHPKWKKLPQGNGIITGWIRVIQKFQIFSLSFCCFSCFPF